MDKANFATDDWSILFLTKNRPLFYEVDFGDLISVKTEVTESKIDEKGDKGFDQCIATLTDNVRAWSKKRGVLTTHPSLPFATLTQRKFCPNKVMEDHPWLLHDGIPFFVKMLRDGPIVLSPFSFGCSNFRVDPFSVTWIVGRHVLFLEFARNAETETFDLVKFFDDDPENEEGHTTIKFQVGKTQQLEVRHVNIEHALALVKKYAADFIRFRETHCIQFPKFGYPVHYFGV